MIKINPQDVIEALTQQRNAAMDEIARQAGIIKALQRELAEALKSKPEGEMP